MFSVALGAGASLIVAGVKPLWLSATVVVLYALVLLLAQRKHLVTLSGIVQDSPYFLGFILTLIGLAGIFVSIARGGTVGNINVLDVVGRAGTALLATVVGLVMRQALSSFDPGEEARDQMFQTIARGLRAQTAEFHEIQSQFMASVQSQMKVRESLFAREENAAKRYVAALEGGATTLALLAGEYPARVDSLIKSLDSRIVELDKVAKDSANRLSTLRDAAAKLFDTEVDALKTELQSSARSLTTARAEATTTAAEVTSALGGAVKALGERRTELDDAAAAYPATAKLLVHALDRIATRANSADTNFRSLATTLETASKTLEEARRAVIAETDTLRDGVKERADKLRAEIQAIDGVVEELVRVLKKRLKNAGQSADGRL
jgi:hypothetical protein